MTGRKMGRCTAGNAGQGYGTGVGFGRGRGCGRGFGRGRGWAAPAAPGPYGAAIKEDLSLRAQALEQELEAVKNELKGFSEE